LSAETPLKLYLPLSILRYKKTSTFRIENGC
jgi:hypothetical protein